LSEIAPVLLLAIGNESRGDDALGPLLLRRLGEIIEDNRSEFELIEEFQLQVENTLDIKGRRLVLFIDAGDKTPAPFSFYPAPIKCLDGHLTHALSPEALLGIYARVHGESPPPAFVLCVSGMSFELGEPLSTEAEENLERAIAFSRQLMARPSGQAWQDIE
jgi:hydrogenase maturation protease